MNANCMKSTFKLRGFSLIELMIVVAVIGIISMIALPSYRDYVKKANRSAAQQLMLNISNREEQYIIDRRQYAEILGSSELNIAQDGWTCTNTATTGCSNSNYTVTATVSGTTYTITATAINNQVGDGNMTLTNAGAKTRSAGDGKW